MKNILYKVKMRLFASKATPAPPVGSALGGKKINIVKFCNEFNKRSAKCDKNMLYPVKVNIFKDGSFEFIIKEPETMYLIKKITGLENASGTPGSKSVGFINILDLNRISLIKKRQIRLSCLKGIKKMIMGTLNSMGIEINIL